MNQRTESQLNSETLTLARLPELVGREFLTPEWNTITQAQVNAFADCTGDHQFIHIDPDRVRAETAFPGTLAHGFLLLSLVAGVRQTNLPKITDAALTLNYGLDRLRFTQPVFVGQRVRYRLKVTAVEPRQGGRILLRQQATLEIEGQTQPGLVAELLVMFLPQSGAATS